jgi:preprotein translocase subunit SecE
LPVLPQAYAAQRNQIRSNMMADLKNKAAGGKSEPSSEPQKKDKVKEAAAVKGAAETKSPAKQKPKTSLKEKAAKFIREYRSELKKIVWYGKIPTIKSTALVLVVIIISAIFIGIFDFAFSRGLLALGKLV